MTLLISRIKWSKENCVAVVGGAVWVGKQLELATDAHGSSG